MRYLLVGGGAAIAYGATRATGDLDFVPARDHENLGRLADAMRELSARLRVAGLSDDEARALPVQLSAEALGRIEVSTWRSDAGDFDLLADIPGHGGRRLSYDDLSPRSVALTLYGLDVLVASLEDIIASKEWADRPKDHRRFRSCARSPTGEISSHQRVHVAPLHRASPSEGRRSTMRLTPSSRQCEATGIPNRKRQIPDASSRHVIFGIPIVVERYVALLNEPDDRRPERAL